MDIYFILWMITQYFLKPLLFWPLRTLSVTLVPFHMFPIFSPISLLSGTIWCFRLTMYFPCSSPRISSSSEAPWLLLFRMVFRNQILNSWCAFCYRGVICFYTFLVDRVRKYIYTLACAYTHIFIYFCVYKYTYPYICIYMHSYLPMHMYVSVFISVSICMHT